MSVCAHTSEFQARRGGFYMYKPARTCNDLLDPRREGEIWQRGSQQKGGCSSHLAGLPVVSEVLSFRGKMKQTVQSSSKVKRNWLFSKLLLQNLSPLLRPIWANKFLVRALIWDTQMLGLGLHSSFPLCDQELDLLRVLQVGTIKLWSLGVSSGPCLFNDFYSVELL